MVNDFIQIIEKKQKNVFSIIKTLYKTFPKQAIFMERCVNYKDLNYLKKIGLIEEIPNNLFFAKDGEKIGEVNSFKLTPFGLNYFNEITLRKTNNRILWLTIILVILAVVSFFI